MAKVDDLIKVDILESIPPEDVESILSSAPFYKLDGGFNTRDISDGTYSNLKPGYAFRSGSLENLTLKGQDELVKLGVTTIFDLRSIAEFASHPAPTIDGIDRIPATINSDWNIHAAHDGKLELGSMYLYMLGASKPGFRAILTHILNFPEKPFLFHCAGKHSQMRLLLCRRRSC
jgi:protein tyrosine/serine phosphatase